MLSEALCFGSCVHAIIANDLGQGEPALDMINNMAEWVDTLLVDQYAWSIGRVPNVRDFLDEIAVAYRIWRADVQPTLGSALCQEQTMVLPLGEYNNGHIVLQGTPDYVQEDALYDWKTAGRGWKPEKAQFSIQASLYPALVKQTLGRSIRTFRFWVYDRSKRNWTLFETGRQIAQIDAALRTAYDWGKVLASETYTATPIPEASFNKARGWYCKPNWCSAWNVCDYKYLGDTTLEIQRAERSW